MQDLRIKPAHPHARAWGRWYLLLWLWLMGSDLLQLLHGATSYYVNDASRVGDEHCQAAGSDANDGRSPSTPKASLSAIVDTYDLEPGDTVYIDAGTYETGVGWAIKAQDGGSLEAPVRLVGSLNGTVLRWKITSMDPRFENGALHVTASNVQLESLTFSGASLGLNLAGDSHGAIIRNCIFAGNEYGINLIGPDNGARVWNCTFSGNTYGVFAYFTGGLEVRHSIFDIRGSNAFGIYMMQTESSLQGCDYNDFFVRDGANVGYYSSQQTTLPWWRAATKQDTNSFDANPLFLDPVAGDFHLQSTAGSWHSNLGQFGTDTQMSPCVGAGDPAWNPTGGKPLAEPIELGAYGGTPRASRLSPGRVLLLKSPLATEVLRGDYPIRWSVSGRGWLPTDVVRVLYSFNGVSWQSVPGGQSVPYARGMLLWDTDAMPSYASYYLRIHSEPQQDAVTQTSAPFTLHNTAIAYYINDGASNGDEFCTAIGRAANDGLTRATPKPTLKAILDAYDLEPGDTVYIDAGIYDTGTGWQIASRDGGSTNEPVHIKGSLNGTVLQWKSTGAFDPRFENGSLLVTASNVLLESLTFTQSTLALNLASNSRGAIIRNCIFAGNEYGINLIGPDNGARVWNCTFSGNTYALYVYFTAGIEIRNSIFDVQGSNRFGIYMMQTESSLKASDYNNFHVSSGGVLGLYHGFRTNLASWRAATSKDQNSLSLDPLFVNAAANDFHLQSSAGSWRRDGIVIDPATSPVIDAGDPAFPVAEEPFPNGERVDLGAYGGTPQASRSLPSNDPFAQATELTGISVLVTGHNTAATLEVGEPPHDPVTFNPGGKSVWWQWTAPADGRVEIHTTGSSFDTLLAVYRGTALPTLTRVAQNNDDPTSDTALTSRLEFEAEIGVTYWIAVDGYRDGAQPAESGLIQLSLEADARPTIVLANIGDGRVVPLLTPITFCADATDPGGELRRVEIFAGEERLYSIEPTNMSTGTFCLKWVNASVGPHILTARATDSSGTTVTSAPITVLFELPNDSLARAIPITASVTNLLGTNLGATADPVDQLPDLQHGQNPGGASVWYLWTAPAEGMARVTLEFDGAPFSALVTVFEGSSPEGLRRVAWNDQAAGLNEVLFTNAIAGTRYWIRADGVQNSSGETYLGIFTLDIRLSHPPAVFLTMPAEVEFRTVGTNLVLTATAGDSDGTVTLVEFLLGESVIGSSTGRRFTYSTNFLPEGVYTLTARATDNLGFTSVSTNSVQLTVVVPIGSRLWELDLNAHVESGSPAVGPDGTLYVATTNGVLHAVRRDGVKRWTFKTSASGMSPASIGPDGTIYVGSGDGNLYALHADGSKRWELSTGHFVTVCPVIGPDRTVYIGSWNGQMWAVDPDTGVPRNGWPIAPAGNAFISINFSMGTDGNLYVPAFETNVLVAVTPTGSILWRHSIDPGSYVSAGPVVDRAGRIYFGTTSGLEVALNPDGTKRWQRSPFWLTSGLTIGPDGVVQVGSDRCTADGEPVPGWSPTQIGGVYQTAAFASDGSVYFVTEDAHVKAVDLSGTVLWSQSLTNQTGRATAGAPMIGLDGTVYVAAFGRLQAFKGSAPLAEDADWPVSRRDPSQTGSLAPRPGLRLRSYPASAEVVFPPAVDTDGSLYITAEYGEITAYEHDGTLRWRIQETMRFTSAPLLGDDGRVYVSEAEGRVIALDTRTGTNLWVRITQPGLEAPLAQSRDGTLYAAASNRIHAIAPDGTPKWVSDELAAPIMASTSVAADGTLYVAPHTNQLVALRPGDGSIKWVCTTSQDAWVAPPIIGADGTIYLGGVGLALTAVKPDGAVKWINRDAQYVIYRSPVVAPDGTILFTSYDSSLYALSPHDGTLQWSRRIDRGYGATSPAVGADGTIYVGLQEPDFDWEHLYGQLLALSPDGKTVRWRLGIGHGLTSPVLGDDGTIYVGLRATGRGVLAIRGNSGPPTVGWPMEGGGPRRTNRATPLGTPPEVTLTAPAPGSIFVAPATLTLAAQAQDPDGHVVLVEFFSGETRIGAATAEPFAALWTGVESGDYPLRAIATDNTGSKTETSPINIRVIESAAPRNDALAQAIELRGNRVITNSVNLRATAEPGEPLHARQPGGRSVWWRWTAPATGTVRISTAGSTFDTLLAIYTGDAVNKLATITSDDDGGGNGTSTVVFESAGGTTYWIAVDGFGGATGGIELQLSLNTPPAIRLATPTNGAVFVAPASLLLKADAADPDGRVVIVEFFTASSSLGHTTNSPFEFSWSDVVAGDYTLLARAIDNDGAVGTSAPISIRVDPPPPPNDAFVSAIRLNGAHVTNAVSTLGATREPGEPDHAGRVGGRSAWWTWTAPFTADTVLSTHGSSFDTLLAVYAGPTLALLQPIANDDDSGGDGSSRLQFRAFEGVSYRIAVDGFAGNAGHVELTLHQVVLPVPSLVSPTPGDTNHAAPAIIPLTAKATDQDGHVVRVEFYQGAQLIGTATNAVDNSYSFLWTGVESGTYALSVRAVDNEGHIGVTLPALVVVQGPAIAPRILESPSSLTLPPGAEAVFNARIAGSAPLAFQWRVNGAAIPGATNATLRIPAVNTDNSGAYELVASNTAGEARTSPVTLTVTPLPQITRQPESQTVPPGFAVVFSVEVLSDVPVSYQWNRDGAPLPGATSSSLSLPSPTIADAGLYSAEVTSAAGSVASAAAILAVQYTPVAGGLPVAALASFWVPDGPVYALVETNGLLYVGGDFQYVGPSLGHAVLLDPLTGSAARGFPRVDGDVWAAVDDGEGGWFLGGVFTSVEGVLRTNLVHIRSDRTVDPVWAPNPDRQVRALARLGDVLYVGGQFQSIGNQRRTHLAAIDARTGTPLAWQPQPNGPVFALLAASNHVFVAGQFAQIDGVGQKNLAQLEISTGRNTGWNPNANGAVFALAREGGTLYAGGEFTAIGGLPRNRLAALDEVTADARPGWNPDADNRVRALALHPNGLVAGGDFSRLGPSPRPYLALINREGNVDPWEPVPNSSVHALEVRADQLMVGGQFTAMGSVERLRLAAFDLAARSLLAWNPAASRRVSTILENSAGILVGGELLSVGGVARSHLAAINTATGQATSWNVPADRPVRALALTGNTLVIGGEFTRVADQTPRGLAALHALTGKILDLAIDADQPVLSLTIAGGKVYAGGFFTQVQGQPRSGAAAFDLANGALLPWAPHLNGAVYTLTASSNTIYLGGDFTSINESTRQFLGAVDAVKGTPTVWNPTADKLVNALLASGPTVYAGGHFSEIGGASRSRLAALDAVTGLALPWDPAPTNTPAAAVGALAAIPGHLYAGGVFSRVQDAPRSNLARLDSATASPEEFNPAVRGPVYALAATGDHTLFAGGEFTMVNGLFQPNLAAFMPRGAPVLVQPPHDLTVARGSSARFVVQATGETPLVYRWLFSGADLPGATNEILAIHAAQPQDQGLYQVVISNRHGLVRSSPVALTVQDAPQITAQPDDQQVQANTDVRLSVQVSGTPPLSFQWQRNGVPLPAATNSILLLPAAQTTSAGAYRVVVGNAVGVVASRAAIIQVVSTAPALVDPFHSRVVVRTFSGIAFGNNRLATREPGEPLHARKPGRHSLWISWQAPASGIAVFDTQGSGFDTLLGIYTGSAVSNLVEVTYDEDQGGFFASQATFNAVQGVEYQIAVDGFGGSTGPAVLNWQLEETPEALPRLLRILPPFQAVASPGTKATFVAEVENGSAFRYQWLHNEAPVPGATNAALIVANVQPDDVGLYRVVISGSRRSVRSFPVVLEIGPVPTAVTQDKFKDLVPDELNESPLRLARPRPSQGSASVTAGVPGSQLLDNFEASTEADEPLHGGVPGGSSRWFNLHMDADGVLMLDTLGSDIDTVMAVYTGTRLSDLNHVASDNNSAPDGVRSLLRVPVVRGEDLLVAVDGVDAAIGKILLNWQIGTPPRLTAQPSDTTAAPGETVSFSAAASGVPAPLFQWSRDGIDIPGATNALFRLQRVDAEDAGTYRVRAFNFAGTTDSTPFQLLIRSAAGFGISGAFVDATGMFRLRIDEATAGQYVIEHSTDLIRWTPLDSQTSTGGTVEFADPLNAGDRAAFYRVRRE